MNRRNFFRSGAAGALSLRSFPSDLEAAQETSETNAKWTSERRPGRYGLHANSTIWPLARGRHQPSWFAGGHDARSIPYKDVARCGSRSGDLDVAGL